MSARCPICRAAELPAESRSCPRCGGRGAPGTDAEGEGARGRPIAPYTPPHLRGVLATRSALEGERKDVSVLVLDVAGSLAMAHRLDPEDVHTLMDGLFALALDAVHAEHGTINQFRGDGLMALFGAPAARMHHAVHAVRAALAIRRGAEEYERWVRARFALPLVVRIGIHTGTVWVGSIGNGLRRDYTAEGATVGVAARLEELAGPGQILVSGEIARRVRCFFELVPLGPRALRGVPQPVEAFEVVGAGPHESPLDAERASGLSPLVGRAAELARAHTRLGAVGAGEALWLELAGEAGIGKSRLALEIREGLRDVWLEGRCRESNAARAYSAWLDLLRRWLRAGHGTEDAAAVARMLEGLEGAVGPEGCEAALRALLERTHVGRPASILLEDVQWIDESSRRVAAGLLERPPACGLRLVATARPEARSPADLPGRTERIALAPLCPADCVELARSALAGAPDADELAALAAGRSGGNPLFVLEVARALAEGGDELRRVARLELDWRRAPLRLPDSLEGVVASRLDALPDAVKRVLQTASVIGRPFDLELLERIDGEEGGGLARHVSDLVAKRLLVRLGEDLDFQHGLYREVAYAQMLRARRGELHRRCAAALEQSGGAATPERSSEIGWHYDLGGVTGRAAQALARAGSAYLAMFAAREAASHLRRAWELLAGRELEPEEQPLRLEVGLGLARALNTLDRSHEAAAVLESLDGLAMAPGERLQLAQACIESGWARFSEHGEVARPLALLERGIALARGEPDGRRAEAQAHAYRIRICHLDGEIARAAESARRVAELATAAGERFGVVFGTGNEGYVLCDAGAVSRARDLCEQAHALAREARHEVGLAFAGAWLAKALVFCGEPLAALRSAEEARRAARQAGQVGALYSAEIWTGAALLLLEEPKRAAEAFERVTEINATWPTTLDWLALARLETGRLGEAAELARQCLAAGPPRLVRARALRTLGLALSLASCPDPEAAEEALGEALALALELELRPHAAETHWALAEACGHRGDDRRAAYYAQRAIREWERCGMAAHVERGRRGLPLRA